MKAVAFGAGLLLALGGCTEYELGHPPDFYGEFNPPEVETPIKVDTVTQMTTPKVDILWVLDNSSSMTEEAAKIQVNFPLFIDYFIGSGLDWHVGIISTDMEHNQYKGKLVEAQGYKWLDPDTKNPEQVFWEMTPLYEGVSHEESGRQSIYTAIAELGDTFNAGFIRPEASLHIVLISDENDTHSQYPGVWEFIEWLKDLKSGDIRLTFSSIVGLHLCANSSEVGTDYINITQEIGGMLWSICEGDWAPVLDALGEQSAGLSREFFLSELPVIDTIEVSVVEEGTTFQFIVDQDYVYNMDRNSIVFNEYVPTPLAQVEITYEVLAAYQE